MNTAIAQFKVYLSPEEVKDFCPSVKEQKRKPVDEFKDKFAAGFPGDPHPMKDLPFLTEADHTWKKRPDDSYLHDRMHMVKVYGDGTVGFSKPNSDEPEVRFKAAPREARNGGNNDLSIDNLKDKSKDRPLLVDPYAAVLATYDKDIKPNEDNLVKAEDFEAMREANKNIADFIRTSGRKDGKLDNFFGMAVMMDTASRTPQLMAGELIEHMMNFYADYAQEHKSKMWVGTGTEHLPANQRGDQALKQHKNGLDKEAYIHARKRQIDILADLNKRVGLGVSEEVLLEPIIFPAMEQNGLSAAENIEIALELGNYAVSKGMKPIMHKLGSPFLPQTDYVNDQIVKAASEPYQAIKSSVPMMNKSTEAGFESFSGQKEDYFASSDQTESKLYTGDDRNFALVWLWAAKRELEQAKLRLTEQINAGSFNKDDSYIEKGILKSHSRNGYTFLKGINANALLGYIGLNPEQTAKAIVELSNWFYDELDNHVNIEFNKKSMGAAVDTGTNRKQAAAEKHLESYLSMMLPAMAMSTQAFFSPYNPTKSYTDYVTAAHKMAGVELGNGRPLPHRRMDFAADGHVDQQRIFGQQLAWQFLAGTHDFDHAQEIIDQATDKGMLERN